MSAMMPTNYEDGPFGMPQSEANALRRRNWEFHCFCGDSAVAAGVAYAEYNDAMVDVHAAGKAYAARPMSAHALSSLRQANDRLNTAADLLESTRAAATARADAVRAIGESINWAPWNQ